MSNERISLRRLLDLLPDLSEFDALRRTLRSAASQDPAAEHALSTYSTIDARNISASLIGDAVMEAEAAVRRRIKRLYDAANIAFFAITSSSPEVEARQLVALGEAAEAAEQWRDALAYFLLANGVTRRSTDAALRALVLRRVGRAALYSGDFAQATYFYSTSFATASVSSDAEGQIVASTGMGNIAIFQGRWSEADNWFERAIQLCATSFARERGQLLVNRSVAARESELYPQAQLYLDQASEVWQDLTAADRAGWYNNLGLLKLATGELADAQTAFEHAMLDEPAYYHRAMVLDNMSEVALLAGNWQLAIKRIREAEEFASAHGSPRALGEIYLQMGRIARARRDPNGYSFFDKAVELTRDKPYPMLIGEIYFEYGLFRREFGEFTAARELWQTAMNKFGLLGAINSLRQVENALAKLPS